MALAHAGATCACGAMCAGASPPARPGQVAGVDVFQQCCLKSKTSSSGFIINVGSHIFIIGKNINIHNINSISLAYALILISIIESGRVVSRFKVFGLEICSCKIASLCCHLSRIRTT